MRVDGVETVDLAEGREWTAWPVYWSAVWVGVLSALALALVFGLVSVAVGAHQLGAAGQIVRWGDVSRGALVFAIFGAFLSAALGGWVAGKIAGIRRSEPAMLHGALTWLVTVPLLLLFLSLGAGNAFGGWYGALMGSPTWVLSAVTATDPNAAMVARNGALAAVTGLLVGLMGSVVGGWLASGEPMTFTYYRTRDTRPRPTR
ncbi:MAG TPA: hypothetical protein VKZ50_17130 [bacterium]|nr:hypothetical protein [bacterium]